MDSIKFDCYSTISFKASDPLSHSCSYLGAWWEVDLGEGVAVSTVIIYNRNDGDASHASHVTGRLSNSVVSLINYQGNTLKTYRIGDASNVPVFVINFDPTLTYCGNLKFNEAVWGANANGHTCGARVTWLQSSDGGNNSGPEACTKVASEFPTICTSAPSNEFITQYSLDDVLLKIASAAHELKLDPTLSGKIDIFKWSRLMSINALRNELKQSTMAALALATVPQFNNLMALVPELKSWNQQDDKRKDYCAFVSAQNSLVSTDTKTCMCDTTNTNTKPFAYCMFLLGDETSKHLEHQARQRRLTKSNQEQISRIIQHNRIATSKADHRELLACELEVSDEMLIKPEYSIWDIINLGTKGTGIGIKGTCSVDLPVPLNFLEAQMSLDLSIPDLATFEYSNLVQRAGSLKATISGKICLALESELSEEAKDLLRFYGIDLCFMQLR
jgi:hypothetical protein